ncbi:DUF2975 domain-containing protein [Phytohabitans sp. ZYX-F-186]|uniref:DUF2975 domain-containing protein n=1 Tax=Phytohabitans maris TaxID=3071409 RepID=A0ABU0ZD19_9ACTN|nr:DUF2975 domain-containing protein [Phytohabitans sp. ZYX-F-186]MDQ7904954.1 DUF2975 domain-containing protein [Phytohabitans sp. ZYX-F-186]
MPIKVRLTRLDWLGLLWFGLVGALLFTAVATLFQVTVAPSAAFTVGVPLSQAGGLAGPGRLPDGVSVEPSAQVRALVEEPTATQSLLHMATSLPTKCVVIAMLFLLVRIVREARRGDPFTAGNVRLLRLLGLTVIAGGLAADVVEELAYRALAAPIVDGPVGGFFWSGWWLVGIAFLAIAEVFKRGVRMRVELDGVI